MLLSMLMRNHDLSLFDNRSYDFICDAPNFPATFLSTSSSLLLDQR